MSVLQVNSQAKIQPPANQSEPLLKKARQIALAAQEVGGRAFLVGGYVRDALLGLSPKDADLEVYGIEAEALLELLRRFGRVDCVGESFRVYKLVWQRRDKHSGDLQRYELDVSLPRRDKKVGAGHRGFLVEGDPQATVEEAARRRDFTINAILCDPLTGDIVDPFHGQDDLKRKVLRAVDDKHFAEDSLRVLRAMQFAARFEMEIEPSTVELCRTIDLSDLPKERIWGEWEKMLTKPQHPALGLRAGHRLGVLGKLFPPLEAAMSREGDKLCRALDNASEEKVALTYERQITLLLAAIGVFLGGEGTKQLLDALGVKTLANYPVREQVLALIDNAAVPFEFYAHQEEVSEGELRRIATRCEPRLLYALARALGAVEAAEWFINKMRALGVEEGPPVPLLMGRHLLEMGLKPGRQIGEITRAIYEMQIDGTVRTLEQAQDAARCLFESE
ncbi:MAG: CCA tRNA nucleotidyltransferase [Abitibacteriaceae bacterium]|nr:CCA tRNA nucleotidyltransferase [Abditibacteriaceae bacterium]